jgi:hypothetical protein
MAGHSPYAAAACVTTAVGVITSAVWAAQVPHVPPHAPIHGFAPGVLGGQPGPMRPAAVLPPPNLTNTPGSSPVAQVPGLAQASQFAQPAMNQPGQPPFGEMLYSMQTFMNQPGVQDFYTLYNPAIVQANEGIAPGAPYPGAGAPQTGIPAAPATSVGKVLPQGPGNVGFYNGFGPGQADWGFYSGFTGPR